MNKTKLATIAAMLAAILSAHAAVIYQNDFEKADIDKAPPGFLILNGDFAVKQTDGNKALELPGAPLDSFGVLFGPATNGDLTVSARIFGTGKGRRYPSFGVGLNGGSGYRLQVSPAKGALEIFQGDASVASVPFQWKSASWTEFRLRVHAVGAGAWRAEGKAWPQGSPEPSDWMVSFEIKQAPPSGRASLWGSPFSGEPIRFDDLILVGQ